MLGRKDLPIACLLVATVSGAADQRVHVEFKGMFSGRPDPVVQVSDSAEAQAILDSLAARLATNTTCTPTPPVALTYDGVRLDIDDPLLGKLSVMVGNGCLQTGVVDPERNLERLAVSTAFRYEDVNAVGGPAPMIYLACAVPQSLHPEIAPCATAAIRPGQAPSARPGHDPTLSGSTPGRRAVDGSRLGFPGESLPWSITPR